MLTWYDMETILRGLQLYIVDGNDYRSFKFVAAWSNGVQLARGSIKKSSSRTGLSLLGNATTTAETAVSRRFLGGAGIR